MGFIALDDWDDGIFSPETFTDRKFILQHYSGVSPGRDTSGKTVHLTEIESLGRTTSAVW
jgi:hypothetical protein